jgi:hypothetical protein
MRNQTIYRKDLCRRCGCTDSRALADARTLGFQDEFQRRVYTCCQIVGWADEQWLAWVEAAVEDGKSVDDATKLLEIV